jgi:hypothetical protein
MNPFALWLKVSVVSIAVLFARSEGLATDPVPSAESQKPVSCATSEYRQFDFWVGDWDAFDVDNPTTVVRAPRLIAYSMAVSCGRTMKARMNTRVRASVSSTLPEKLGTKVG